VTPTDAATVTQGGTRQFSATGLDNATTYTIELFACGSTTTDSSSQTSFKQTVASPASGIADQGTVSASDVISVINGVATGGGNKLTATPTGGSLTFTVKNNDAGTSATSCVTPVVYVDANADGKLQVDKPTGQPSEAFGVGGDTSFSPAQATNGLAANGTVTAINDRTSAEITSGGSFFTVNFRSGDRYEIAQGGLCPTVTADSFFTNLSVGDTLATQNTSGAATPYSTTAANDFCLGDVQPANPTTLAASAGTPSDTSVNLTWTAATNATSYNVYMHAGVCTTATTANLTKIGSSATATFTATGLSASTVYCFVVTSVSGSDESTLAVGTGAADADNTVEATTSATTDSTKPKSTAVQLTTSAGFGNQIDVGDHIAVCFDEVIDAPAVNDTIRITDADGTVADIINGPNATFSTNPAALTTPACPAGQALQIIVNINPTVVTAGSVPGVQRPATITDSIGITDVAGNSWDLAGSPDKVID